jgi:RimJ/RimL family protein N-acetyltransferase
VGQAPDGFPVRRKQGVKDVTVIALRPVADADLDALFDQMRDPESVWMAAFTPADPDDRSAFDAHMAKVRSSSDVTLRAVVCDGRLVGSVAAFVVGGETDVTYWIDRAAWGRGIASRALELLMDLVPRLIRFARSEHRPDIYGAAEYCGMGGLRDVPGCGNSVEDLANAEAFGNYSCQKSPL